MAKVTEYPRITKLKDNDIFLVDGPDGTRTILQKDAAKLMGGEVIMVNETAGDATKVVIDTTDEEVQLATMEDLEPVVEDVVGLKESVEKHEKDMLSNLAKAKLIACFKCVAWTVINGGQLLQAFCNSISVDGWIDVKPKTTIDSSTGEIKAGDNYRQASDFIDVHNFVSFTSVFSDNLPYPVWYAVKCFDENKAFLGNATMPSGNTGSRDGSVLRTLVSGTHYIRLLFTPNTTLYPTLDLTGIYTGRLLVFSLYDSSDTETKKSFALTEVEEFNYDI